MRQWQGSRGSCTLWRVPAEPKKLPPLLIHVRAPCQTDRHRATPAASPGRGRGRWSEQGGLCLGARPAVRPLLVTFVPFWRSRPMQNCFAALVVTVACCLFLVAAAAAAAATLLIPFFSQLAAVVEAAAVACW